jgi:hypothetical protein
MAMLSSRHCRAFLCITTAARPSMPANQMQPIIKLTRQSPNESRRNQNIDPPMKEILAAVIKKVFLKSLIAPPLEIRFRPSGRCGFSPSLSLDSEKYCHTRLAAWLLCIAAQYLCNNHWLDYGYRVILVKGARESSEPTPFVEP